VTHVTVIERQAEVIELVGAHLCKAYPNHLTIVHADAYTWNPPGDAKFDLAWHDIWMDLCEDNLDEMTRIVRHYQKVVAKGGQDCWGRELLRSERRRNRGRGW
jgi:hypothetical protein